MNDSSLAVLPIPAAAFVVPHFDLNEVTADDYLKRCEDLTTLGNRRVEKTRPHAYRFAMRRIALTGIRPNLKRSSPLVVETF